MADLTEYPANMAPKDALVVRQEASKTADHAVVPYSGDSLGRAALGPANPFRTPASQSALKRKNVLTGYAEEIFISEHSFRSKHRAVEGRAGPERRTHGELKAENARLRARREPRGDATVAEGDNAYVGPWAKRRPVDEYEDVAEGEALRSDEEYDVVDDDDNDVVMSGTVVAPPVPTLAQKQEAQAGGKETTRFLGESEYDYQGRTYMHVPLDLDVDLRKEPGSVTNYHPKRLFYTWKDQHVGGVTALRLFPTSSHLGLSSGNDGLVKIFDIYHNRDVLRSYAGHAKAVCDIDFNHDGTRFLSASYDRHVKVWDTETGACLNRFSPGKTSFVARWATGAEHRHEFLVGTTKKILQYDARAGGDMVQEYDHHLGPINSLVFVDEGRRFMSTSDDRSLRAWDYGIPVPIKYIADPEQFALTSAARHPGGKYVLYQASNEIQVYSATDKFRQNRKKSYRGHNSAGLKIDVCVSPDGQFVASGDTAGYVVFWDWKTCKMYHKIQASKSAVSCVVWSEQETSKVLTAGEDSHIKMWD
ncbi:hypothetical protein P8C59_003792 [Phyllachora maydis]|uniref:Pre-mRNA-processing factor 17 n=1 Tax=Phyllachora maydis TaxID=1825666 RepID=A0AAD9I242_9PEZI|nr:hypothetical protein P8C59_003792 [Phyllachora maydis]